MDKSVLRDLTYGMYIISSKDGERFVGCTINTAMQVSSEPVIVTVCINHNNYTNECIKKTGGFALSILTEEATAKTIGVFGFQSSRTVNKFATVDYQLSTDGFPVLKDGVCAYLSCRIVKSIEIENYTVFFGELTDAGKIESTLPPMTYAYYHKVIKGKAPVAAPTFGV